MGDLLKIEKQTISKHRMLMKGEWRKRHSPDFGDINDGAEVIGHSSSLFPGIP
jgi:hypothetical protein